MLVDVYEGVWSEGAPEPSYGSQLVWGHPDRVSLTWLGDQPGTAVDESLPRWSTPIGYDQGEVQPDQTRVSLATARRAVAEFVATGQRPTCVTWQE